MHGPPFINNLEKNIVQFIPQLSTFYMPSTLWGTSNELSSETLLLVLQAKATDNNRHVISVTIL